MINESNLTVSTHAFKKILSSIEVLLGKENWIRGNQPENISYGKNFHPINDQRWRNTGAEQYCLQTSELSGEIYPATEI